MINEFSAHAYCCEDISLIENYNTALNSPNRYVVHHRLEIELNKSVKELKELNLYYNRPASELIFLSNSEHCRIHSIGNKNSLGHINTDEHNTKISNSLIGKKKSQKHCSNISKGRVGIQFSDEHRKNISISHRGKKLSEKHKMNISLHSAHFCPTKGKKKVWNDDTHTSFHFE